MGQQGERRTDREATSIDVLIKAACRVAGSDEIGAIHVVTSRRPTYAELMRYRQLAGARDLDLNVDASSVTVRPHNRREAQCSEIDLPHDLRPPSNVSAHPSQARPRESSVSPAAGSNAHAREVESSVLLHRISSAIDWLSAHGQAWRADLSAMSEGTR
jgi:hypothetical protein